jgi:hypothetical protein
VVYVETSALTGHNVDQAFRVLIQAICDHKRIEMEAKKGKASSISTKPPEEPLHQQPIRLKKEKFDYI